jgi:site-specific DNA-methyltransferase (adenine-specific)
MAETINEILTQAASAVYNMDCMEGMAQYPDKYFDLAVVDPPYGIGVNHSMGRRKGDKPSGFKPADWDKQSPPKDYFDEVLRVSKNQIIWGANHFISLMPYNSSCWLMWDKGFSEEVTFAQFELAWTSFNSTAKKFDRHPTLEKRIHPTQKPIALYDWIYKNYLPEGGKVIDTHLGSGSNRIAAYKAGNIDFTAYEIDKDYYEAQEKRFIQHIAQTRLF